MSEIGRHIAKYRKAKGLTQDALGERLHVTRQTISSWENGRTQPDLQMLSGIAESLGVSVEQLIYGRNITTVPRDVSRYRWAAVISALLAVACICATLCIRPMIGDSILDYRIGPDLLCSDVLRPLTFLSAAVCALSLISLLADISVPDSRLKLLFVLFGAGMLLAYVYFVLVVYSVLPGGLWAHHAWRWISDHPYVLLLPGLSLFFGLNRHA